MEVVHFPFIRDLEAYYIYFTYFSHMSCRYQPKGRYFGWYGLARLGPVPPIFLNTGNKLLHFIRRPVYTGPSPISPHVILHRSWYTFRYTELYPYPYPSMSVSCFFSDILALLSTQWIHVSYGRHFDSGYLPNQSFLDNYNTSLILYDITPFLHKIWIISQFGFVSNGISIPSLCPVPFIRVCWLVMNEKPHINPPPPHSLNIDNDWYYVFCHS